MNIRTLLAVCLLAVGLLSRGASAQDYDSFVKDFNSSLEIGDEKRMDRLVRDNLANALRHFEGLSWTKKGGGDVTQAFDAMHEVFRRVYKSDEVLNNYDRWVGYQTSRTQGQVNTAQKNQVKIYEEYARLLGDPSVGRKTWDELRDTAMRNADQLTSLGHVLDAAQAWSLAAEISSKMPQLSLDDRRSMVSFLERFIETRKSWNWTHDPLFTQNAQFLKSQKVALEEAIKEADARKAAGYEEGVDGIEGMVMPEATPQISELTFEMQDDMYATDYYVGGGPVPAMWIEAQILPPKETDPPDSGTTKTRGDGAHYTMMNWFTSSDLYLVQEGVNKYGVGPDPEAPQLVEASNKPKPSKFFLDADKTVEYAMWFYLGSNSEVVGSVQQNLEPSLPFTAVFYKSAASWTTEINGETVTFYDDNANGKLFEKYPMKDEFKLRTLGDPEAGTVVPLLDSMKVGSKGDRVPYSEFIKVDDAWFHLDGYDGKPGVRPLNPEFLKLGEVELKWKGVKKAAPKFLVLQGRGPLSTVRFDVAGGKAVELPVGKYDVLYGRIESGKAARVQVASIFGGSAEPIEVTEGKTTVLTLGEDVHYDFPIDVDGTTGRIDLTKMVLRDGTGVIYTQLHNVPIAPDIVFGPKADSKRSKVIESLAIMTDPNFVTAAGAKLGRNVATLPMPKGATEGNMTVKLDLPAPQGALGMTVKKHPIFGRIAGKLLPYGN